MFIKLTHAKCPGVETDRMNQTKNNTKYKSLAATQNLWRRLRRVCFMGKWKWIRIEEIINETVIPIGGE
jgi:hypothetical protein